VRVGGAAGATVREGDVLVTVDTKKAAMRAMTVFLQYYREEADYLERTYDFVPRVGLDAIRELLGDAPRCAGLMERFRLAKAAAFDPWRERDEPHHPSQFLEIVGAPA
jgi:nitrite reductase (NADH) large subunit